MYSNIFSALSNNFRFRALTVRVKKIERNEPHAYTRTHITWHTRPSVVNHRERKKEEKLVDGRDQYKFRMSKKKDTKEMKKKMMFFRFSDDTKSRMLIMIN